MGGYYLLPYQKAHETEDDTPIPFFEEGGVIGGRSADQRPAASAAVAVRIGAVCYSMDTDEPGRQNVVVVVTNRAGRRGRCGAAPLHTEVWVCAPVHAPLRTEVWWVCAPVLAKVVSSTRTVP